MITGFIFELTADGTIQYLNPAVTQLTGYSPEELRGVNWWQTFFPHEDEAAVHAGQEQILNNDESQVVMPFAVKDGSLVELEIHTALRRGADGSLERITGFAADVDCNQPIQESLSGEEVASPAHLSKASQKYYQTIFEHTLDAVLIVNDEDRFIDANPAACDLLGYPTEALLAMKVPEVLPPADRQGYGPLKQNIIEKGHHSGEIQLLTRHGAVIDVEYDVNADILPGVHIAILHDLTARKRTRRALQESEQRYNTIFENSLKTILIADDRGHYIDANPAACRLLGYNHEELLNMSVADLFSITDQDQFESLWQAFLTEGDQKGEVRLRRKDGTLVDVEYHATANILSGAHLSIMHDVSDRVGIQQALAESEERYRQLVELSPDAIGIYSEGKIEFINSAGARMIGVEDPQELIGRNYMDFIHPGDLQQIHHRQKVLDRNRPVPLSEVKITRPDGSTLQIESTAIPFIYQGKSAVLFISRDITERVLAEQGLQKSEARYRSLFEESPMSLWEDDFSGMKAFVNALREQGISDLRAYLADHPEAVFECLSRARILDVNRATLKIYRASTRDELLGGLDRVLDPSCYRDYAEGIVSIAEGRTKFEIETVNRTLQGEPIDIVLSWSVAPGSASTYDQVLVSIFDITDRKLIQQAERDQRALAEALRDVSSALNGTLNYEEVLDRILDNIARVADFDMADILLVEDGVARVVRHLGYEKVGLKTDGGRPMCFKMKAMRSLEHMLASGLPLVIPDTSKFDGWLDIPELRFIKSFAGAPIRVRGNVIGFLNITSTEPDYYDQNYAPRLQVLADQAAIALQNAHLFDQVQAGRERLRMLTLELVSAQEAERHRLSRELHDEAGQSLTVLKIALNFVHDEITPHSETLHQQVGEAITLTEETMNRLRFLAQDLRPPALDAIGLVPTLKDLCEGYAARSDLRVKFVAREIPHLSDALNVGLYRFLQEALTNVIKHAQAEHVVVKLKLENQQACLSVSDDGRGFDQGETAPYKGTMAGKGCTGIGLLGMQERIELLGGKLKIDTSPGSGTTLVAQVPVEEGHLERRQSYDKRRYRR